MRKYDIGIVVLSVFILLMVAGVLVLRFYVKDMILPDIPQKFSAEALDKLEKNTMKKNVQLYNGLFISSLSMTGLLFLICIVLVLNRRYFEQPQPSVVQA